MSVKDENLLKYGTVLFIGILVIFGGVAIVNKIITWLNTIIFLPGFSQPVTNGTFLFGIVALAIIFGILVLFNKINK